MSKVEIWMMVILKLILCCLQTRREPGADPPGEQSPRQERVKEHELAAWMQVAQKWQWMCAILKGSFTGVEGSTVHPSPTINMLELLHIS